jgi:hypothetical protein
MLSGARVQLSQCPQRVVAEVSEVDQEERERCDDVEKYLVGYEHYSVILDRRYGEAQWASILCEMNFAALFQLGCKREHAMYFPQTLDESPREINRSKSYSRFCCPSPSPQTKALSRAASCGR